MSGRYRIPNYPIPASRQREKPGQNLRWIGKSMKRVEDLRLLTGQGNFIDDVHIVGMTHAAVLRSPYAHARIVSIDVSRARALPGVILVVTGKELAETTGPVLGFASPPVVQYALAIDRVRHVGEGVVAVVAEDRYIAEDALELIDVEFEELPIVSDPMEALNSSGDSVLHPDRGDTNIAIDKRMKFGPVDEDFARADVIVRRKLRWNRAGAQPMETVGAVAEFNSGTNSFVVRSNGSMYNHVGWIIAQSLFVPSTHFTVIPSDVGGSFGSKFINQKVVTLAAALSRLADRPVKFMEDRLDNMVNGDGHAPDRIFDNVELALTKEGRMLALRFTAIEDYGAYLQFGYGNHGNVLAQVVGPYRINSVDMHMIAVLTNKVQQGAMRGFGSEVGNYMLERIVDAAASEMGIDPVELRRINLIQPDEFPYVIPTGNVYDSGDYPAVLNKALAMFDYNGWRQKQLEARAEGRCIGIGVVTAQERSTFSFTEFWSLNPIDQPGLATTSTPESISVRIDPTGKVFAKLNAPHWGNSPETVVTQVLAEMLSVSPNDIKVGYTDSSSGFDSIGPGGSRYTVMITGAAVGAALKLKSKIFKLCAHMLECSESDLEFRDGTVGIKGVPSKNKSIAEIAFAAHYLRLSFPDGVEYGGGLDATDVYDHPLTTMPAEDRSHLGIFYPIMGHMVHLVAIEIDSSTGKLSFLDYVAVHDCGTIVNPMGLDGQVRGGTVMGIGTALYEQFHFDEYGQVLNASFADYHIPTAQEVPAHIRVGHVETPSPYTEFGIKGAGEGGRMASPAAMASAVEDALRHFGVQANSVPLTPRIIRTLIRAGTPE